MIFSIVVPIYNVEKYLPQCIESVLNQPFSDFELILVDDGSRDSSGIICDEYARKDNRIRVIHKENGGVSDARNVGISVAKGKFIWFLDADDFMDQSALNSAVDIAINNDDIDMITCAHINKYSDGSVELVLLPFESSITNISREEFLFRLYKINGAYWAPWKNIYRKSVIKENNLYFLKDQIISEDCDFFMRFVLQGKRFAILNKPLIHYRIDREGSITNTMSKGTIMGQLAIYKKYYDVFRLDNKYSNMEVFFANKFANAIYNSHQLDTTSDIDEINAYIKENESILKETKGVKYSIAKLIWSLFGYHKGSKILHKINPKSR